MSESAKMSRSSSTDSFVIDADVLARPNSKRPHHLQERLSSARPKNTVSNAASKRQEILETRKNRLSKRLQHVSAVVNKHQRETADERNVMQSNISEQMNNADSKRAQRMQDRKERSGKIVEKAKTVARKHREQDDLNTAKLRQELESRMWTAEFRQKIVSRVPRSKILDASVVDHELRAANFAARRIQRWWRRLKVSPLLKQFALQTGLLAGFEQVAQIPFQILVGVLSNPNVVKLTGNILKSAKQASLQGRRRHLNKPSKVFLSAYVIVHHTDQILHNNTDDENSIKQMAGVMLTNFEKWIALGEAHLCAFVESWFDFHISFDEWKVKDTENLVQTLLEHYKELQRLQDSVRSNVDYETEWKPRLEMQKKQICDRAIKFGGRKIAARFVQASADLESGNQSDADVLEETEQVNAKDSVIAAVPEEKVDAAQIDTAKKEFGNIFSNERMAHEIILDPDYEIKKPAPSNTFESQIAEIAKKAFFDKIAEDIAKSDYNWLPGMVEEIRKQFAEMLDPKGPIAAEVNDILDPKHIRTQLAQNTCDVPALLRYTVQKMLQLCAPIRDADIRALADSSESVVIVLQKILSILDDMKLDLMNYRLRSVRPALMQQAAQYEEQKFAYALNKGVITLNRTNAWITTAGKAAKELADARNPENIDSPANRVRYESVYYDALLSLIFGSEIVNAETCPETLLLDTERLVSFQNEIQALTVMASLTMLTRNMFSEMRDDAILTSLKNDLLVLLQERDTNVQSLSLHIASIVRKEMAKSSKSLTAEQEKLILTMVDKTLSYKDKVFSLLNRRILAAFKQQLNTGKYRKDPNSGLDVVQCEVESLSHKVFLLAKHNRAVHARWYDELIRKSLSE